MATVLCITEKSDGKSRFDLVMVFSAIFLGTLKISHQELKEIILKVDDELTESLVNNLMKQLPEQEVIDSIKEFKKQFSDLELSEQFLLKVSPVL